MGPRPSLLPWPPYHVLVLIPTSTAPGLDSGHFESVSAGVCLRLAADTVPDSWEVSADHLNPGEIFIAVSKTLLLFQRYYLKVVKK